MRIRLNGRELDAPPPLTVGDWRRLAREKGITVARVQKGLEDPDAFVGLIVYSLQRVDPSVTEAEIDALTLPQLLEVFDATKAATDAEAATLDRPTSTPSITSPSGMDGAPTTSADSPQPS